METNSTDLAASERKILKEINRVSDMASKTPKRPSLDNISADNKLNSIKSPPSQSECATSVLDTTAAVNKPVKEETNQSIKSQTNEGGDQGLLSQAQEGFVTNPIALPDVVNLNITRPLNIEDPADSLEFLCTGLSQINFSTPKRNNSNLLDPNSLPPLPPPTETNSSAFSSDDESFLECHSYVDTTLGNSRNATNIISPNKDYEKKSEESDLKIKQVVDVPQVQVVAEKQDSFDENLTNTTLILDPNFLNSFEKPIANDIIPVDALAEQEVFEQESISKVEAVSNTSNLSENIPERTEFGYDLRTLLAQVQAQQEELISACVADSTIIVPGDQSEKAAENSSLNWSNQTIPTSSEVSFEKESKLPICLQTLSESGEVSTSGVVNDYIPLNRTVDAGCSNFNATLDDCPESDLTQNPEQIVVESVDLSSTFDAQNQAEENNLPIKANLEENLVIDFSLKNSVQVEQSEVVAINDEIFVNEIFQIDHKLNNQIEEAILSSLDSLSNEIESNSTIVKMPENIQNNLSRTESFEDNISNRQNMSPKMEEALEAETGTIESEQSGSSSPTTLSSSVKMNVSSPSKINNQSRTGVFVENFVTDNIDITFKVPRIPPSISSSSSGSTNSLFNNGGTFKKKNYNNYPDIPDEEFRPSSELLFTQSDFDYLLTKGNNNVDIDRSSILLKFDPLFGHPVQPQSIISSNPLLGGNIIEEELEVKDQRLNIDDTAPCMSTENDIPGSVNYENHLIPSLSPPPLIIDNIRLSSEESGKQEPAIDGVKKEEISSKLGVSQFTGNATMSVDVIKEISIENNVKPFVNNINSVEQEKQEYKMAELEKKIKNEVLKTEDIEKKLKDAETREEALLKRITEKDKTIAKMSGVMEAYEKAIAELIAEKEQIIQNYEKKCTDIQNERDLNSQHLTSLEATFSDLHVKYERSKQITMSLKKAEETLLAEKKQSLENSRLQEQRYEKMKSHAMQQLEMANNKLDVLTRTHSQETAKLKALLKKEEISRLSVNEQLQQKTRENAELVKICDELISGSGGS